MANTASGYRYPVSGDAPTLWTYYQNLATDVEQRAKSSVTSAANRTGQSGMVAGQLTADTTANTLWQKTATGWQYIGGPEIFYSGTITAGSVAPPNGSSTEFTTSSVVIADPGYPYRLLLSGALVITQNVSDARVDMRVYDGPTLVAAATKPSLEVTNAYSTEMAATLYPKVGTSALTGTRTMQLRIGRNITTATTALAVAADAFINHFTIQVVPS